MSKQERKCPSCGSTDVKVLSLPLNDEEEFIYCNTCKSVNVVTKVKVNGKQTKE